MRRYLLVIVTIAVVLSLALVGCVGQPAAPEEPTPEPTPTTPPTFEPIPADGAKVVVGREVTFDWSTWDPGFEPQYFTLYWATGTCDEPSEEWNEVKIEKDPCCPIETSYTLTATECGVYWWKVFACGEDASATTDEFMFCVVPAFEVLLKDTGGATIAQGVVDPDNPVLNLTIDPCDLPASITIYVTALEQATLCATTTWNLDVLSEWFLQDASGTLEHGVSFSATELTTIVASTTEGSPLVCTAALGQQIAELTFTVFPDIPGEGPCCPSEVHCCKTEYTVNISLDDADITAELWDAEACPVCASPTCACGWFVLKVPTCLASITDLGTITIYKAGPGANEYTEMYTILPEDESDFKVLPVVSTGYKYLGICLTDAATHTEFATALELGATYYVDMKKGAFKLNNGKGVTFGWPCTDWDKTPLQAK
ncbi:MAG: hypothetical protein PWQ90_1250 [Pseudothermotoga sp.]|nr:hypothetical protein [Pseudothermotoga sp.]